MIFLWIYIKGPLNKDQHPCALLSYLAGVQHCFLYDNFPSLLINFTMVPHFAWILSTWDVRVEPSSNQFSRDYPSTNSPAWPILRQQNPCESLWLPPMTTTTYLCLGLFNNYVLLPLPQILPPLFKPKTNVYIRKVGWNATLLLSTMCSCHLN
jgi:hypothetical protein